MKLEPTDTDREAAKLFSAAGGMRVAYFHIVNSREKYEWCRVRDTSAGIYGPPGALDTDDPATVGVMLAQVEAQARPMLDAERFAEDLHLMLVSRWRDCRRLGWRVVDDGGGAAFIGPLADTRGAALVAAMRALKGQP